METMDDFKDELEASFRQIKEGDIITGTVIAVSEEEITLDLKYYAQELLKWKISATILILQCQSRYMSAMRLRRLS